MFRGILAVGAAHLCWTYFVLLSCGWPCWGESTRKQPGARVAEIQSTTLFGDHPFSIKHPQDNFGLQNVNWHPPKCKLTPSKKGLATSNLQFLYRTTQKSPLDNLYFGGRQFAFWRLKLSWGGFIEKGGPQKGWYFSFPPKRRISLGIIRDAETTILIS